MDFQLQDMMDWYDNNKDWFLIPFIIALSIEIIGFVLLLIFSDGVNMLLKVVVLLLLLVSPVIGYLLGEYVDPFLAPVFDVLKK